MFSNVLSRIMWPLLTMAFIFVAIALVLIYAPNSPLPHAWNPTKPLIATDKLNFLTARKLTRATQSFEVCQNALDELGVSYSTLPDRNVSPKCHIKDQVQVEKLSIARLAPLKTTCGTALRLAMWEYHVVQPIARQELQSSINRIDHFGSYSCRPIRNSSGETNRMSEHATANAVDISGFRLPNGKRLTLLKNWDDTVQNQRFMRGVRDGGCVFYNITLSPDYNALHADHFHFDNGVWRTCR